MTDNLSKPPVIVIAGVRFSPNLGDGVIGDCLSAVLRREPGSPIVREIDIAGRTDFPRGDGGRLAVLNLIAALPHFLQPLLVFIALRLLIAFKYRAIWQRALHDCDLLVIGGGQLLADTNLNFPVKVSSVAAAARRAGARIAIHACGVGSNWSPAAHWLFRKALLGPDVVQLAVRDSQSQERLEKWLPRGARPPVEIAYDPGLLASEVYGVVERPPRERPLIALGIAHPSVLRAFAGAVPDLDDGNFERLMHALIDALVARGYAVRLFTNGAFEDDLFMRALYKAHMDHPHVEIAARPTTPEQLVRLIAQCDGLIAHRLHANIVAWSYGVASVGLGWDVKLESFFALTGQRANFIALRDLSPGHIAGTLQGAMAAARDVQLAAALKGEARAAIAKLAARGRR